MLSVRNINPMARAVGTMGVVVALVGGVTYALTSSPATVSANSINTSAGLEVYNSTEGVYDTAAPGFTFTDVVPGGASSSNQTFYLKNNGTTPEYLSARIPTLPDFNVLPSGHVHDGGVSLNIGCTSGSSGDFYLTTGNDFKSLNSQNGVTMSGGPLKVGDTATCTENLSMTKWSVWPLTANSVTSSDFNVDFTGTN